MEEEKLIEENEEAVQEEATLDSQEVEDLTEEERLAKEKKEKRAEKLQPLKYFLFACSAGVIQFVSALVIKLILDKFISPDVEIHFITNLKETTFIADTIGLGLSVIWNFTFNRKFTFKDAGNVPLAMALAFLFYVPFYPFQIWYIDTIEKAIIASTGGKLEVLPFIVAQGTCMVYNFILEFLWQKFVVFRKPKKNKE
ncbi:MAG: hypothetical protein J5713_04810 [Clostridia bacterium]|nr:hypothetical protein [Clostridia bacterium]